MDIEGYRLFLIKKGLRQSTVRLRVDCLMRLLRVSPVLSVPEIRAYILSLFDTGRKASYINLYIDTIRSWAKFSKQEELGAFEYFREGISLKATMSDEEIELFLALPPTRGGLREAENYARWTMFFKILAFSGMRCGEVAHLAVDSVDFGRGIFVLEDTKTHEPRYVPIAPNISEELKDYIKKLKTTCLFPSRRGGMHRQNGVVDDVDWGYNFHTRLKRLNIKRKNLTPYSLRHSFITRLLEEDVNLFKVQKIVGHRRLETTARYTHLTTKDIQRAILKHPIILKGADPLLMFENIKKSIRGMLEGINALQIEWWEDARELKLSIKLK